SGFFIQARWWIRVLSLIFILPWALPSIPTILSIRFMLNPEWGIINSTIFKLTFADGPNWLNDPHLALSLALVVHIWKALPVCALPFGLALVGSVMTRQSRLSGGRSAGSQTLPDCT